MNRVNIIKMQNNVPFENEKYRSNKKDDYYKSKVKEINEYYGVNITVEIYKKIIENTDKLFKELSEGEREIKEESNTYPCKEKYYVNKRGELIER